MNYLRLAWSISLMLVLPASSFPAQSRPSGFAHRVTYADMEDPFPSPDGKWLVYTSTVEGYEQVMIMQTNGAGARQITRDPANHENPAWSPDGKKIAYVSDAGGHSAIHVMNTDGSADERVTDPTIEAIHPMWSGDSKSIIFCADDDLHPPKKNPAAVFTVDLASRQMKQMISGGVNTFPSWSPDGSKIAFRRMLGESNSEVFVANADGTGAANLTAHPAFDGWPAWSPDGKRIAFASNRNGAGYQIFVMDANGGNVKLLANTEGRATSPRWSVDGKRVFFTNCYSVDALHDCHIFVVDAPQE